MRISLARLLAGVWRVDQAVASVVAKLDALEISGPDDPRDSTRVRESRQVLERLNDEAAKTIAGCWRPFSSSRGRPVAHNTVSVRKK